jgi:hypothetical protein
MRQNRSLEQWEIDRRKLAGRFVDVAQYGLACTCRQVEDVCPACQAILDNSQAQSAPTAPALSDTTTGPTSTAQSGAT